MVQKKQLDLTSIELLTLIYTAITTVMILLMWNDLSNPWSMLGLRTLAVGMMIAANIIAFAVRKTADRKFSVDCRPLAVDRIITSIKIFPMLILLIWWYPDIFEFCSVFPYQDHIFAGLDQMLFGCQPALEFDQNVPSPVWSELFCLGYYGYYYMMAAVIIFYLLCRYDQLDKAGFIFMASFFLFYFIFDFLPVAGPQFYFRALLDTGHIDSPTGSSAFSSLFAEGFPQLGHYFRDHREMISPDMHGIFGQLVIGAQEIGERPAAAFPSSHVGMGTVMMLLAAYSRNKWLFWIMLPIYLLLCCGTVYIKAHYLIDSISGFFTAIIFFYLTRWLYSVCFPKSR